MTTTQTSATPSAIPAHLLRILAGSVRAAPAPLPAAAPRALPTDSPLKTRTSLASVIDDMGDLETHDSPLALVSDDEGEHLCGAVGIDTLE